MLHGAGISTYMETPKMAQFCRKIFQHHGASGSSGICNGCHPGNEHRPSQIEGSKTTVVSTSVMFKLYPYPINKTKKSH